jgi:hypothetical protein
VASAIAIRFEVINNRHTQLINKSTVGGIGVGDGVGDGVGAAVGHMSPTSVLTVYLQNHLVQDNDIPTRAHNDNLTVEHIAWHSTLDKHRCQTILVVHTTSKCEDASASYWNIVHNLAKNKYQQR